MKNGAHTGVYPGECCGVCEEGFYPAKALRRKVTGGARHAERI